MTAGLLANETRGQALHILSYALNLATAWPVGRDLPLAMAPTLEQAGYRDEWNPYLGEVRFTQNSTYDHSGCT